MAKKANVAAGDLCDTEANSLPAAEPASYDDAVMTILAQLDRLQGLARSVGDKHLAGQIETVFQGALTRYCDSKHADLNSQMRHHFKPPKLYMN